MSCSSDPYHHVNVLNSIFLSQYIKVSQEAYSALEESLSKVKPARQARAVNRLNPAAAVTGRQRFCAIPEGYSIQEVWTVEVGCVTRVGVRYRVGVAPLSPVGGGGGRIDLRRTKHGRVETAKM